MNLLAFISLLLLAAIAVWGWLVASRRAGEVRRLAARYEAAWKSKTKQMTELYRLQQLVEKLQGPELPVAANWTVIERDQMAGLLASEFGRKLITRLQATEYVLAVTNAQDKVNPAHSAGVTAGYNQCLRHILSLSQSACVVAEKPNDSGAPDGEAQPIEREALEYEARMSP